MDEMLFNFPFYFEHASAFQESKPGEHWTTELPFVGAKIGPTVLPCPTSPRPGSTKDKGSGEEMEALAFPVWRLGGDQ